MARRNVQFPPGELEAASRRLGYSVQAVCHQIGISEATWHRWKTSDRVPVERVTDAVLVLGLPMPDDLPQDVSTIGWRYRLAAENADAALEATNEALKDFDERLRRVEERLDLDAPRSG